jgi:hypothetical protein
MSSTPRPALFFPLDCITDGGLCSSWAVAQVYRQLRESVLRNRRSAASPVAESRRPWTSLCPLAIACEEIAHATQGVVRISPARGWRGTPSYRAPGGARSNGGAAFHHLSKRGSGHAHLRRLTGHMRALRGVYTALADDARLETPSPAADGCSIISTLFRLRRATSTTTCRPHSQAPSLRRGRRVRRGFRGFTHSPSS